MPFLAAPTGCWRRSSGVLPPDFPTPRGCGQSTVPARSIPEIRSGRRYSPSAPFPMLAPEPDQPIELLILGGSQGAHILGAM